MNFTRGLFMEWSDERIEALTKLWREGLSASQVARQLGGVSRSAVIGKIHRLGIAGREAPSRPHAVIGRPAADREPDPAPSVGIMAIHCNLHGKGCYRAGGSGYARLRVVVIMAPWSQHLLRSLRAQLRADPTSSAWARSSGCRLS